MPRDFDHDLRRIKEAASTRDLATFDKVAEEIAKSWRPLDAAKYSSLMLAIADTYRSEPFQNPRQFVLARDYAERGLNNIEAAPAEVEVHLVLHTRLDLETPDAFTGKQFAEKRREQLDQWVHAWKRLQDGIDPRWTSDVSKLAPEDRFTGNVAPPAALKVAAGGMSPESIQDPKLRAEYEAAIEKNRENAERWNHQRHLHKLLESFGPAATKYIIALYSRSPNDNEELKRILSLNGINDQSAKQILDSVNASIRTPATTTDKKF